VGRILNWFRGRGAARQKMKGVLSKEFLAAPQAARRRVVIRDRIRVAKQAKCPCGSGRRYARCCGLRVRAAEERERKVALIREGMKL